MSLDPADRARPFDALEGRDLVVGQPATVVLIVTTTVVVTVVHGFRRYTGPIVGFASVAGSSTIQMMLKEGLHSPRFASRDCRYDCRLIGPASMPVFRHLVSSTRSPWRCSGCSASQPRASSRGRPCPATCRRQLPKAAWPAAARGQLSAAQAGSARTPAGPARGIA